MRNLTYFLNYLIWIPLFLGGFSLHAECLSEIFKGDGDLYLRFEEHVASGTIEQAVDLTEVRKKLFESIKSSHPNVDCFGEKGHNVYDWHLRWKSVQMKPFSIADKAEGRSQASRMTSVSYSASTMPIGDGLHFSEKFVLVSNMSSKYPEIDSNKVMIFVEVIKRNTSRSGRPPFEISIHLEYQPFPMDEKKLAEDDDLWKSHIRARKSLWSVSEGVSGPNSMHNLRLENNLKPKTQKKN